MATLSYIWKRIESKRNDFRFYDFSQTESNALAAFFDLAQEFNSIEDFYFLCTAVPKAFFDLEARLYVMEPKMNGLALVAKTEEEGPALHTPPPSYLMPGERPYRTGSGSLALTIRGKKFLIDLLPFKTRDNVLGLLEIYPDKSVDPHRELFFEKYANRIGFNIHNRFLFEKNIEHLKFIKSLVADIEHNIIVPNMVYKLFLRRLKGKIAKNVEIERLFKTLTVEGQCDKGHVESVLAELIDVNQGLTEEFENIDEHYRNMSLFLETLLRRSHFDQGRLTLRTTPCNIRQDVVRPQLERFIDHFKEMSIAIDDEFGGLPSEEIVSVVDVGLVAQVYANFFSNALKYAREVVTENGEKKKYMSYGREILKDYFGQGKDGVKYNVFSTGPHIDPAEREKIFDEGYRGSNAVERPGTGHGLTFVKNAVEIHGGVVGYEATQYGNNFYFIFPKTGEMARNEK
ncbi:MAG: HAMP domain-containing histidine kinase [Nitrospirae bacterium]|nr:HAMP domain-containing histidine kinase [Nitrospirota bacterium]